VENVYAYDAIEPLGGDIVRLGKISDESCVRICRAQIENIDPGWPSAPEPAHIPRILKLQAAPPDPLSVGLEEPIDIVPMNRDSALVSE
jgi:hypothetical protein